MDERITLEPVHDETGHYVIATVKLAKIVPQKCDGKTPREAVEEAASMLIDLCDVLFDEAEENRADLARLRRERDAAIDRAVDMERAIREFCEDVCFFRRVVLGGPCGIPAKKDCPLYKWRADE